MTQRLSKAVTELSVDLDLWAREAARGNRWEPIQERTLQLLQRVEEGLKGQGFKRKAKEVRNLSERLSSQTPDFTGATKLTHDLAKLTLHEATDRAA